MVLMPLLRQAHPLCLSLPLALRLLNVAAVAQRVHLEPGPCARRTQICVGLLHARDLRPPLHHLRQVRWLLPLLQHHLLRPAAVSLLLILSETTQCRFVTWWPPSLIGDCGPVPGILHSAKLFWTCVVSQHPRSHPLLNLPHCTSWPTNIFAHNLGIMDHFVRMLREQVSQTQSGRFIQNTRTQSSN